MIVKVENPKSVYVDVSKFGTKESINQWYASCYNPNYIPDEPSLYGYHVLKVYESEHLSMLHTERLYFHKDGKWRTTCANENHEFTAYFETKNDLIDLLINSRIKYEER
jgi:hypothetical protein